MTLTDVQERWIATLERDSLEWTERVAWRDRLIDTATQLVKKERDDEAWHG